MGGLIFHRPLTHWIVGVVAPRITAKFGLPLTLRSSGSIWSDLTLAKVTLATGSSPWIQTAEVDELSIHYNLRALINRDFEQGIRSIKLHGMSLQADLRLLQNDGARRSRTKAEGSGPPKLVWPDEMDLEGVSVDLILMDGRRLIVRDLFFQVFADRSGRLGFKELRLDSAQPDEPPTWVLNEVEARLTRVGQVLIIENLSLPYGVVMEQAELDLSGFSKDEVGLTLALTRGVAAWHSEISLVGLFEAPLMVDATFEVSEFRSGDFTDLKLPTGWQFEIGTLRGRVAGEISKWSELAVRLELAEASLMMGEFGRLDGVAAMIQLAEGSLQVESLHLKSGDNELALKASVTLPDEMQNWRAVDWQAEAVVDLSALEEVLPKALGVSGKAQAEVTGSGIGTNLASLKTKGKLKSQDLQVGTVRLPLVRAEFDMNEQKLHFDVSELALGDQNKAVLSGMLELSKERRVEGKWDVELGSIPELVELLGVTGFRREVTAKVVTKGEIAGSLNALMLRDFSRVEGQVSIAANQVNVQPPMDDGPPPYGAAQVESIMVQAEFENGRSIINEFEVVLDAGNRIQLKGETGLTAPYAFVVSGAVDLPELVRMNPLLAMVTTQRLRSGRVKVGLAGQGQVQPWNCQGDIKLTAEKVRLDHLSDDLSLVTEATFDGQLTTLRSFDAVLGPWELSLNGLIDPAQLKLDELRLDRHNVRLVEGRALVPLRWLQEGSTLPLDVLLRSNNLPVHEVLTSLGIRGAPAAVLNAEVTAVGTVDGLAANVDMTLTEVRVIQLPTDWPAGKLTLRAALTEGKASVEMGATQSPMPMITLKAEVPFDLRAVLKEAKSVMQVPIVANLRVPETDLRFVKQFAPTLFESFPAVLKLEADLSGTLERPSLRAVLDLDAAEILLMNPDYPSVRAVRVRLRSEDQLIRIEDASMLLAGGGVKLEGEMGIEALRNPTLDLRFTAREALVYRDPTISVRADADLTCRGDLASATVAGEIAVVRGRVFKEIDVAPALRLPTSAPALPPDPARTGASINLPPFLDDWNFDVRVRTREPVLLAGNLFNGAIAADLKVGGTGVDPQLTGVANVERFLLRLPFSTINVTSGTITLNPERPHDPQLDFRAESRMPSHFITLYAFGPLSNVRTRMSSSPPMREPDIATLLATGTTLSGDGSQMASEAVVRSLYLYVSEFYRKTFNKKKVIREQPPRLSVGLAPSNVGADRAGEAMQATYDLTERWRVVGQFARSGRVRAALGFLVRFGKSPASGQEELLTPIGVPQP